MTKNWTWLVLCAVFPIWDSSTSCAVTLAGLVTRESDEVGIASDDFYRSDSLNSNGRWIDVGKWGRCWQPTAVPNGWSPYTNGSWREGEDCGWTFVSEEPWAWCCYHYGRWCKVRSGCGWAWVPGKIWAASWVAWRRDKDGSCSCIGWAPLPPEASCEFNVGIGVWVDQICDIGPDCYTFINIRDFGSDSYLGCGCIYERSRNAAIIIDTVNVTNICHAQWGTYCGGPDLDWCNERIRDSGGKEIGRIYVNRYGSLAKLNGESLSHIEGDELSLFGPLIKAQKHSKYLPKAAEHLSSDKIDKGWDNVRDKKLEKQVRNQIAQETKGKTPANAKAKLPEEIARRLGRHTSGKVHGEPTPD